MTVILVLLTIIAFLAVDWIRNGHKWAAAQTKQEIYYHNDMLPTMADGGEKICPHCGQAIKTK